ncbi:MAG: adenylate/guanylate cyclase domain-containing protein [Elusimicrobia bacterium]|nr:adenylate/guanylate cyclase domain-containing protein [Elusimicrobiota bacterium]
MRLRRFQDRVLLFFLGLLTLVQAAGFIAVNAALARNARRRISAELEVGSRVFARAVEERTSYLTTAADVLSGDFAFKTAYATGDKGTIVSALENHKLRLGADEMFMVSLRGRMTAGTLRPPAGKPSPFAGLAAAAAAKGSAAAIVFMDGRAYQALLVPLMAPEQVAWLGAAFLVDDRLAQEIRKTTLTDISFVWRDEGAWKSAASTLPGGQAAALLRGLDGGTWKNGQSFLLPMEGRDFVTLVRSVGGKGGEEFYAVLQRALDEELKPFFALRATLFLLFAAGLLASAAGGVLIARTVTRPVHVLLDGVRRVGAGDYGHTVDVSTGDEIGELAEAFNQATKGLAERDRVRSLLGKVVSPQVAEELLGRKEVTLEGEERVVTTLFSDIRDFTALGEKLPPRAVLETLNEYLTRMSAAVERNGGVVDKYIGDAVMAVFGAPVSHEDDADRAVRTALEMLSELEALNADFAARGLPRLGIGIGINTASVVAGNMGSSSRLNYTVIGDGVNLASRLQSLTKDKGYASRIIISGATRAALKNGYGARHLGEVTVKGRSEPTTVYGVGPEIPL